MPHGNTTFNTVEIDFHIRQYRNILKSSGFLEIASLIDSHKNMHPLLHEHADEKKIDTSAFIYSLLRLPESMSTITKVILAQSFSVFKKNGYAHISKWKEVTTPGRRRKMYYNGRDTLAVYIASVTDVDDIITLLTAFQIEWNKIHGSLKNATNVREAADKLLPLEDREKIEKIWADQYHKFLTAIKHREIHFSVYLLSGGYVEYAKSTHHWWEHVQKTLSLLRLNKRPIYFVSSNTHSLINLITKFAVTEQKSVIDFLYRKKDTALINLWENINNGISKANKEYFLYYIAKKALREDKKLQLVKAALERKQRIHTIPASHYLDIDVQVIEIGNAVIVNIDYPLGWAAYQVLTEIGQNADTIRGIYILGKAATLSGQIGDIMLPNTIFDQHTKNIYAITNCFSKKDIIPLFHTGIVMENQKTVSVKGTFFESSGLVKSWYSEGYTDLEMEAGPYLNAVYEFVYYNRYEENQFVNLTGLPFDLGIIHYASDTPYSKAKNLGVRNLSYEGVESTYAATEAILNRIINREIEMSK